MKRIPLILVLLCLFCGCSSENRELERAMALRQRILTAGCRFETEVTADYGDRLFSFSAQCSVDTAGDLTFTITGPKNLEGISGNISDTGGKLTFDDTALNFPLLADGQLSPVSAPWIFINTFRRGYMTSAGKDGELLCVTLDDSYQEDALQLDIWIDGEDQPIQADILHSGRRILSVKVKDFQLL